MLKLLIVDDHAVVREGLKHILCAEFKNPHVLEAENADQAMRLLNNNKLDMVILDITMPGRSGLDVLREIHKLYPRLHVLVLSIHPESQYALRVIKSGASGYMTKESAPHELVSAVERIFGGKKYLSEPMMQLLVEEMQNENKKPPHEELSNREFEILCMIADGKPLKDIAGRLRLSPKTVSTYRTRLLAKMNMDSNAELTRYALENDLVE